MNDVQTLKRVEAEASGSERYAVIDIGSNSIRMVVFDRLARAPVPVFNEKVLCGLGLGIESTGRLNPEGIERAVDSLHRFVALAERMNLAAMDAVATAAVRDAGDGLDFVARVQSELGLNIEVVSGADEAGLSGLGLLAGIPDARGVMGDLGGGSLELVAIADGRKKNHRTLPLGALRLQELQNANRGKVRSHIAKALDPVGWLSDRRGELLYPVGGAWRSLARLHMAYTEHPISVIHQYRLGWGRAAEFLKLISNLSPESLEGIGPVSRRRRDTLPLAAQVLLELGDRVRPQALIFSALGLREGCLYKRLPARIRHRDPLLDGCRDVAARYGRHTQTINAVERLVSPLIEGWSADQRRLAKAAMWLSDISWAEHPDYRGSHALQRILTMPLVGVDHPGRAFLASVAYARYTGDLNPVETRPARDLLDSAERRNALILGLALRLAFTIGGGLSDVLAKMRLRIEPDQLVLLVSKRDAHLVGEIGHRRLDALAQAMELTPVVTEPTRRSARSA
ncbi:MAG: Ppx/GppA family phosphatase [Alphaproteobacteria bacterium]|nr:Ppx/GppA family phosphatase [Alphaproteobacteria bacterium]